jgi:hypothetical protein
LKRIELDKPGAEFDSPQTLEIRMLRRVSYEVSGLPLRIPQLFPASKVNNGRLTEFRETDLSVSQAAPIDFWETAGRLKIMRILRSFGLATLLAAALALIPSAAHAQVAVGIGIGPVVGYPAPVYVGGPPVCSWGYYGYYPYACAPYGYYGADWFAGGLFIGAGPWYGGWYGRPWGWGYGRIGYYGWRGGYGGYGYRGGYAGGYRGGYAGGAYRGGYAGGGAYRGGAAGGYRGGTAGGAVRAGGGGGFHGGGGGGFHGGGGGGHR